jgi:hypothetical protein
MEEFVPSLVPRRPGSGPSLQSAPTVHCVYVSLTLAGAHASSSGDLETELWAHWRTVQVCSKCRSTAVLRARVPLCASR